MLSVGAFSVLMAIGHGSVSSSGYSMSVRAYKEGSPYSQGWFLSESNDCFQNPQAPKEA